MPLVVVFDRFLSDPGYPVDARLMHRPSVGVASLAGKRAAGTPPRCGSGAHNVHLDLRVGLAILPRSSPTIPCAHDPVPLRLGPSPGITDFD